MYVYIAYTCTISKAVMCLYLYCSLFGELQQVTAADSN
jgi:hypothetical protein